MTKETTDKKENTSIQKPERTRENLGKVGKKSEGTGENPEKFGKQPEGAGDGGKTPQERCEALMELGKCREKIDEIDRSLAEKLVERMKVSDNIGKIKSEAELPITDSEREKVLLKSLGDIVEEPYRDDCIEIFHKIISLSKGRQKMYYDRVHKKRILVINGPNINMLGLREPEIYGKTTYADLVLRLEEEAEKLGVFISFYQSNHQGDLVDAIQDAYGEYDGIIINPAAYTHTSIAILDALRAVGLPTVEVHISDIEKRENYRKISYTSQAAMKVISGMGIEGYIYALRELAG